MRHGDELELMRNPDRWPFRVLLPLASRVEDGPDGFPRCALLARGRGAVVFFGNVGDFEGAPLQSREAFEAKLLELEHRTFDSFEAIVLAGWRVD